MLSDIPSSLAAVAELGRRALSGAELDTLYTQAVEIAATYLHVEFVSLWELLPDGDACLQAGVGWREETQADATIELSSESAAGHVIRTLEPLVLGDLGADCFAASPLLREHRVQSSLLVPLHGGLRPLGVLSVHSSQPRNFSAEEVSWLQLVAQVLSSRLEQKRQRRGEYDQQLLRGEQMMAIGQVAAGVAHELRNPLTSIKGLIQVNLRDLQERGLPADDLAVIEHEIRRMERTLQTFLDFARPPQPDRAWLDLATLVQRVFALVSGRARKQHVSLQLLRPATTVEAEVDQDQIQQLLLNLVLNALDVMPQRGSIEVDLRAPRDGFIDIYIRDTGPGIAPHILPKVFETFVSSKETGVGLGLPLSRRIAEDHGGTLTAYNLPVAGACFLLRLPTR